jgi:hypothetical protein
MNPKLLSATYVDAYRIALVFSDGLTGVMDFSAELDGPVFEPLKSIDFFKRFVLNPHTQTIEWPNEADFAPDFLYEKIRLAK